MFLIYEAVAQRLKYRRSSRSACVMMLLEVPGGTGNQVCGNLWADTIWVAVKELDLSCHNMGIQKIIWFMDCGNVISVP